MPKGTVYLFIILTSLAFFLIGFNAGKTIGVRNDLAILPSPTVKPSLTPTITPRPPLLSYEESTISGKVQGKSTYTNTSCGFSISYPESYISKKSVNNQSVILTDPAYSNLAIATTCAETLPRPSVGPENREKIILDGESATLYHDKDDQGNTREDVFVTHPSKGMEIIIAGFGAAFQSALSSFKFIR